MAIFIIYVYNCPMTQSTSPTQAPEAKRKPGRPRLVNHQRGGAPRTFYFDAESEKIALQLGEGNISKGVRIALQLAAKNQPQTEEVIAAG